MSRQTREARLAELELTYELTVYRGSEPLYRTMARGALADVLRDACHLADSRGGDRVQYTRQAQRVPPAPDGKSYEWYVGEQLERGIPTDLKVSRDQFGAAPAEAIGQ